MIDIELSELLTSQPLQAALHRVLQQDRCHPTRFPQRMDGGPVADAANVLLFSSLDRCDYMVVRRVLIEIILEPQTGYNKNSKLLDHHISEPESRRSQRKVHPRCKDLNAGLWFLEEKMFDMENPLGQANRVEFDGRMYGWPLNQCLDWNFIFWGSSLPSGELLS